MKLQRVNRDVSWNLEVVSGSRFGGFCEWYLCFNCPKYVLGAGRDRLNSGCFLDQFEQEYICNFRKNTLKKGDPGRHTTPNVTRFRTGHLAEVVALSSSGDCGATLPLGLFGGVAVGDLHLWCHQSCPRGFNSSWVLKMWCLSL